MLATTFVLALSLVQVVAYTEAVVIVVLLLALGFVWFQGTQWMWNCERAEAERDEARRTLDTFRRMNEIHAQTIARMRGFGR
jgi:hypothetical protein